MKKNTKYTHMNTNESRLQTMKWGQVRQNLIQRTVRTAHLSVHNFSTQHSTDLRQGSTVFNGNCFVERYVSEINAGPDLI